MTHHALIRHQDSNDCVMVYWFAPSLSLADIPMTPSWSVGFLSPRLIRTPPTSSRFTYRSRAAPRLELSLSRDSNGRALVYRVTGPYVFRVAVSVTIGCRPADTTLHSDFALRLSFASAVSCRFFHAPPVPVFGSCAAVAGTADAHCSLLRTRRVSPGGHDFSLCRHAYGWEPRRFFSQPRRGHGPNEASAPSAIAQENKSDPTPRSSSCPSPPSTDCGVCTIQCGGATRTHANCSKPAVRSCLVSKSHPPTSTTFKPREPRRFFSQPRRGHGPNEASAPSAIAQENKSDPTHDHHRVHHLHQRTAACAE